MITNKFVLNFIIWKGAGLAQLVECGTLSFWVVSSRPTLAVEMT